MFASDGDDAIVVCKVTNGPYLEITDYPDKIDVRLAKDDLQIINNQLCDLVGNVVGEVDRNQINMNKYFGIDTPIGGVTWCQGDPTPKSVLASRQLQNQE